jgi:membrane protease YdiL (CAAX protease family)
MGLALLALWRCMSLIPREWFGGGHQALLVGVTTLAAQLSLLAVPLVLARRRLANRLRWPGFERIVTEAALSVPVILGILTLLIAVGLLLTRLAPQVSFTPEALQQAAVAQNYSLMIVVGTLSVLVAPVCEETFFRWFLYGALRSHMPAALAVLVQSFIFAVVHTFGAMHSVAVFFLGLILTAVYEWRKSLLTPIFVHAGNNLFATLMLVLSPIVMADTPVLGVTGHDHPDGYQVDQVAPDSGAAKAHMLTGDVITDIDGQPVVSYLRLLERLHQYKPGDQVTVGINRGVEHLNIEVVLAKRPPHE